MQNLPLLLTIPQVAAEMNVSRRFVDNLVATGDLPSVKIKGVRRVELNVLLGYIADARKQPVSDAEIAA